MVSESPSALISAVIKVQRTALGLDTEKRPFPYRTQEQVTGTFNRKPISCFHVNSKPNLYFTQRAQTNTLTGAEAQAMVAAGSVLCRIIIALHHAVLN